jgi:hypothetical protein
VWWRGRVIVLGVNEDDVTSAVSRKFVTSSAVVSATFKIAESVGVHAIAEGDYDAIHDFQVRVIGVIDLAFAPEP